MANKIVEAFLRGTQIREEKQSRVDAQKIQQEQFKQQIEQQKTQLEQQKTQHEAQLAQQDAVNQFNQSLLKLQQQTEIAKTFRETGTAPGASKITTPKFSQEYQDPGISTTGKTAVSSYVQSIPTDLTGIPRGQAQIETPVGSFNTTTPEEAARQTARNTEITQEPTIRKQQEIIDMQNKAAIKLKELELEAQKKKDEEAYRRSLAIANIRARATTDAAGIRAKGTVNAKEKEEEKLLSPDEAELFQVPYGTRRIDVFNKNPGVKLNPAQSAKITALDSIEQKVIDIQKAMEDPEVQAFFMGPTSGVIEEGRRTLSKNRNKKFEDFRAKLAGLEGEIAKERGGTTFSQNEQKLLENYVVKALHTEVDETAIAKLNNLLKTTRDLRGETLSNIAGRVISQDQKPSNNSGTNLYFDKNGKQIQPPKK